ncbi:acetyltransferase-like protein [Mesorhizobium loti]|nr:acetyltransferase-like protein [Mesorhizobium loti]
MQKMNPQVVENVVLHRFELPIAAEMLAAAYYRVEDGKVVLIHTEVPSEFSGQGIASRLAQGTFELLRKTGRRVVLQCPFMSWFFERHPEYADVVDG